MFFALSLLLASVLSGTWNLKWFPSGRAEHRAPPRQERARTLEMAGHLSRELSAHGRSGDAVVLFFQELRDASVFSNLVCAVSNVPLRVASVSAFRERDNRLGWQQCGIASNLPVLDAGFSYWKRPKGVFPPRGYAYAFLDAGTNGVIACYCVHLKSNYGATTPALREANRRKRETCAEQLAALTRRLKAPDARRIARVIVAGDFNVDPAQPRHKDERTHALLRAAGFADAWEGVAAPMRHTLPGSKRFPGATLDYVYTRGFRACVWAARSPELASSDHYLAMFRHEY